MTAMQTMNDFTHRYGSIVSGVAQAIVIAAILYVATQLTALSTSVAVLQNQVSSIRAQVSDVYTQRDATHDLAPIRSELADHEKRLRALEWGNH